MSSISGGTVALFFVALAAFATEGAIGFGGTVIAACIGAQLVALDALLPAFVVLNLVLSSWLVARGARAISWRVLVVEIAPVVAVGAAAGIAVGAVLRGGSAARANEVLALVFGGFVVGLALLQLVRPADRELPRLARGALLLIGGVAHGLFGTGGPMIVYVARRRLSEKRTFRATLAVLWLALNAALLASFAQEGLYGDDARDAGVVLAVAIVPGLALGELVHRRLDAARFERVVWLVLLGAGAALVVRTL
jgi:hypothetical protein|nr:TSUP family transporter [Kofleriaceae bacterium]